MVFLTLPLCTAVSAMRSVVERKAYVLGLCGIRSQEKSTYRLICAMVRAYTRDGRQRKVKVTLGRRHSTAHCALSTL